MDAGADLNGVDSLVETTDRLANKWDKKVVYVTGTSVPYAPAIEFGRGPVTADEGSLRFEINGKVIYAKSVDAAPAQPFLRQAAWAVERDLDTIARESNSIDEFVRKSALRVEKHAKEFVPVDEGNLRASIEAVKVS